MNDWNRTIGQAWETHVASSKSETLPNDVQKKLDAIAKLNFFGGALNAVDILMNVMSHSSDVLFLVNKIQEILKECMAEIKEVKI